MPTVLRSKRVVDVAHHTAPQPVSAHYSLPTGVRPPFDDLNKNVAMAIFVRYLRMIQHLYDQSTPGIDPARHTQIDVDSLYDLVKCLCAALSIEDTRNRT